MDETTRHTIPLDDDVAASGPAGGSHGAQVPLPFDETDDLPVPFTLTARARRTVDPDGLPPLRVIGGSTEPASAAVAPDARVDDDPFDTRPARARALRRAGTDAASIARQLGVDDLLVRAWIDGVGGAPVRRRPGGAGPVVHGRSTTTIPDAERRRTAFELARADARRDARQRLLADPRLAAGLGLLAGTVEVDAAAVTLTTADPRVAGVIARWLRDVLDVDPSAFRVILRVGAEVPGDLVRHRWAKALEVPTDRLRSTRWSAAPSVTDVEGLVRVVDTSVAATVAGWRDALLEGDLAATDIDF